MIGKVSLVHQNVDSPAGANQYSYCRFRFGEITWMYAVSPVVDSILKVRKLPGVGKIRITIKWKDVNGEQLVEDEVWDLEYWLGDRLQSKRLISKLKQVDSWELEEVGEHDGTVGMMLFVDTGTDICCD